MFWTDPNLYGATFKEGMTMPHRPVAFNPWIQDVRRFTPYATLPFQGVPYNYLPQTYLPYNIPQMNVLPYNVPQMPFTPYEFFGQVPQVPFYNFQQFTKPFGIF